MTEHDSAIWLDVLRGQLTPARRRALNLMAGSTAGWARVSNTTALPSRPELAPLIYWQTSDWLLLHGLAEYVIGGIALTDRGRQLVELAKKGTDPRD